MPGLAGKMTRSNKMKELPDSTLAALEQGLALQIANEGQEKALGGISTGMVEFQKEKTSILDQFAAAGQTPPEELLQQFDDLQEVREQQLVFGSIDQNIASQLTSAIDPVMLEKNELQIRNNIAELSAGIRQEDLVIKRNDNISKMRKNLADAQKAEADVDVRVSESILKDLEAREAELKTRIDEVYGGMSSRELQEELQKGDYIARGISPGLMYRYASERREKDLDFRIKQTKLAADGQAYKKAKLSMENLRKDQRLANLAGRPREELQGYADEARRDGFKIIDGERYTQVDLQKTLGVIDDASSAEREQRILIGVEAEKAEFILNDIIDVAQEIGDSIGVSPDSVAAPLIQSFGERYSSTKVKALELFPNDRLAQNEYTAKALREVNIGTKSELVKIRETSKSYGTEPLLAAKAQVRNSGSLTTSAAFSSLVENKHTLVNISSSDMYHPASLRVLNLMNGVSEGQQLNEAVDKDAQNQAILQRAGFGGKTEKSTVKSAAAQRAENERLSKEYQERFTPEKRADLIDDLSGALAQKTFKQALGQSLQNLDKSIAIGDKEAAAFLANNIMTEVGVTGAVLPKTSAGYAINSVNLVEGRPQQINWSVALDSIYLAFDDEERAELFVDELVENYAQSIDDNVKLSLPKSFQEHQIAALAKPTDNPLVTYPVLYRTWLESDLADLQSTRMRRTPTVDALTEQPLLQTEEERRLHRVPKGQLGPTVNVRQERRREIARRGETLRSIRETEGAK